MSLRLADPLLLTQALIAVIARFPGCWLERNAVGNLAIVSAAGIVGWVDLQTGDVRDIDGEVVTL